MVFNSVLLCESNIHCKATEGDGDQRLPGKEILRRKCGQQVAGTAGGRWR